MVPSRVVSKLEFFYSKSKQQIEAMYSRNSDKGPNGVELQDLEPGLDEGFRSARLDSHNPLETGAEVYRDNEVQNGTNCRWIMILVGLVALLAVVLAIVLGVHYAPLTQPLHLRNLTTTTAFTTESITRHVTKYRTETYTKLRSITATVMSIVVSTQTVTTTRKAKTSLVTAIITTTLFLTSTQTTSELASTSMSPSVKPRCIPPGLYGGEELHQLSSDYDVLLTSNLEYAARHGVDIGGQDPFFVALRSIFTCVAKEDLLLATVCETAFVRTDSTILCDGAEYPFSSSQVSSTSIPCLSCTAAPAIPTTTDTTSVAPITMTRTTYITVS